MGSQYPPILLIHGAWHGKWCYEKYFVDYLSQAGFDAHAIDLPHHGEKFISTKELRWKSLNDYVEAVAAYADNLAERPIVVGHSMGGGVVQKYLEKYEAPAGVLLASMPPTGVWPVSMRILQHMPARFLRVLSSFSMHPLVETAEISKGHFFSDGMAEADVLEYHEQLHDESYRAFLDMLILGLPNPQNVTAPMLVLGGEKDTIFYVDEVEATAKAYNTSATIFPDMAHDMMLEADWQKVADKIIDWVKKGYPQND